jgi:hypothetical protein
MGEKCQYGWKFIQMDDFTIYNSLPTVFGVLGIVSTQCELSGEKQTI